MILMKIGGGRWLASRLSLQQHSRVEAVALDGSGGRCSGRDRRAVIVAGNGGRRQQDLAVDRGKVLERRISSWVAQWLVGRHRRWGCVGEALSSDRPIAVKSRNSVDGRKRTRRRLRGFGSAVVSKTFAAGQGCSTMICGGHRWWRGSYQISPWKSRGFGDFQSRRRWWLAPVDGSVRVPRCLVRADAVRAEQQVRVWGWRRWSVSRMNDGGTQWRNNLKLPVAW